MKQITRSTNTTRDAIITAVNNTLSIFDIAPVTSIKLVGGLIELDSKGMTVYTDGKDVFATPDWALDWTDGEWSGISANGQSFTIVDCRPMVEV
jgi:hypothetical protein